MPEKLNILVLGNSHLVVFNFRGELIEKLISEGNKVTVCFPNGPFGEGEKTANEYGCDFIENRIDRRGTNPLKDITLIREFYSIIKKVNPDVVLAYTVKPDVYGGIVCRMLKIPFFPNITGLGKGLAEGGIVQKITIILYKLAVKKARCVFFQNESDKEFFDIHRIKYINGFVLPGSGVNLAKYAPLEFPKESEPIRFLYVARVMRAKGIEQYLYAAHEIKKTYPNIELHICGYCEEDYETLINEKSENGEIVYHGLVNDVREYEKDCHCVVLPSFHPEGISNVLLEAAACARPIITTDQAGCKPTVEDGITGYIVRQRDEKDLLNKMIDFIECPYDKKKKMGELGRSKIEKQFDRQIVVDKYIEELRKIEK